MGSQFGQGSLSWPPLGVWRWVWIKGWGSGESGRILPGSPLSATIVQTVLPRPVGLQNVPSLDPGSSAFVLTAVSEAGLAWVEF